MRLQGGGVAQGLAADITDGSGSVAALRLRVFSPSLAVREIAYFAFVQTVPIG